MFQGVDVNGRETFIHRLIVSKLGQHHVKCPLTFSKRCVSLVALLQHPHKIYPYTYATQNSTAFDVIDIFVPSTNHVVTP
jgi:hypothetical protein